MCIGSIFKGPWLQVNLKRSQLRHYCCLFPAYSECSPQTSGISITCGISDLALDLNRILNQLITSVRSRFPESCTHMNFSEESNGYSTDTYCVNLGSPLPQFPHLHDGAKNSAVSQGWRRE